MLSPTFGRLSEQRHCIGNLAIANERLQHAAEHDVVGRHGALQDHMVANSSWRHHLSCRCEQTSSKVLKSTSSL